MTLAELTAILSRVCRDHPELAADEKVRRYILLVVEEGRKQQRDDASALAFQCLKRCAAGAR